MLTDSTHKCCLEKRISARIVFELDMLFQGKKNAFLMNTANKHQVVNAISTELKKVGCNRFDNAYIDVIKLVV